MSEIKPTVFNYKHYTRALEEINRLRAENEKLKKDKTNLEIKVRIMEEDYDKNCR